MLTMAPLRRGIISRATRCRQKNTPLPLTRMMRSQSASVRSMMSARRVTPALLTRMSIRPNVSTTRATILSMVARSPTSALTARPSFTAAAVDSAAAGSMSTTATRAPASAIASEIARPMPLPAPVTMATLSASVMDRAISRARLVLVDQHPPQDLSGGGLRDLLDQLEVADALVRRDALGHPRHDRLGRRRSRRVVALEHHVGLGHLAGLLVRLAHHSGVEDSGMRHQQRLELRRRHLEPLVLDQLLGAVDDEEVPLGVDIAH